MTERRQKFMTRTIYLRSQSQVDAVIALASNLPIDPEHPIEAVFREEVKARKPDQNALMWSGPLKDIAEQAWYQGKQYSDVVWHDTFKRLYLPEQYDERFCKHETYKKWDFDRDGNKVLVGSTTDLTIKGFAIYLEQVYADGANMGVRFHANPNERKMVA